MKKCISLILAFVFVIGIFATVPLTPIANAASVDDLTFEINEDGKSYYVSGCSRDASGELVIPGTYKGLPVTSIGYDAFYGCTSITSITIPASVTVIDDAAFLGCESLTSITIPDSVTSIGDSTFHGCYGLKSITIPDSVTSISSCAFSNCRSLKSITIPDGVTSIGQGAFQSCFSLTSITIPDSVISIGDDTFSWCYALTSITIPDSVTSIGEFAFSNTSYINNESNWENGVLYIGNHLVKAKDEISGAYVIKNGAKTIADSAFSYCESLTSITIPGSVTSIGEGAFENCISLTSITLPDSVTNIGESAFFGCTSLTSVYITDIASWCNIDFGGDYSNPLSNGADLHLNGELVTEFTIPESVIKIKDYAFVGCTSLTSVTLPDSITSIGYNAFLDCSFLTSVIIPDSVTIIGGSAFSNTGYYNDDSNWENNVLYIGEHLISAKEEIFGEYTIKNGTKTIAEYAFYYCTSLKSIKLPDSVTIIGDSTFHGCYALTNVIIPDSVTSIGVWAFYDCDSLTSVIIPDSVTSISSKAFDDCDSLTSVIIPDSVTNIGGSAFGYYWNLETFEVEKIPDFTIYGTKGSEAEEYANENGFRFIESTNSDPSSYLIFYLNEDGQSYRVSDCTEIAFGDLAIPREYNDLPVTKIGYSAFYECEFLTSVTIPDSVTSIGNYAFYGCTSLTSITIADSVTSIGGSAFDNTVYYNNESNWENNVLYIGKHLISAKEEISGEYTIKNGTKTIAGNAFSMCGSLTSVTIPDTVTSIGDYAFSGCSSLTSITITDSVTNIGGGVFYNTAYYNNESNWEKGVLYIGNHLIDVNRNEISGAYEIKNGTKTIAGNAFSMCGSLTSVTIPDTVTSIGGSAFDLCTSLTSIIIPDSVTSIGVYAFGNCNSLTSITIPDSVTSIGSSAFDGCTSLANIAISGSVTSIGSYAFGYCYNVRNDEYEKIPGVTICGVKGSEAEKYATDNGFVFIESLLIPPTITSITSEQNGVKFTWSEVNGSEGYIVFKLVQNESGEYVYQQLAVVGASTLAFTDQTAVDGETYCYAVAAMDAMGNAGQYSEFAHTYKKLTTLSTPKVSVKSTSSGVKVSWKAIENAESYTVYRRTYNAKTKKWGDWKKLKSGYTKTSFTDKKAKLGTKYRYTVKAVNGSVKSKYKSTDTIKYNVAPTVRVAKVSNGVKVSWSTAANATSYKIYRSTYNTKTKEWSSWKAIKTAKATSKSYTDKSTKKGVKYRYTVRAVNGSYKSTFKASSSVKR